MDISQIADNALDVYAGSETMVIQNPKDGEFDMKVLTVVGALVLSLVVFGCSSKEKEQAARDAEIQRQAHELAEQHTQELVAQKVAEQMANQKSQQQQVDAEVARLAAEKAKQVQLEQETREKVAADLQNREEAVRAKRLALIEQATQEKLRRETVAADVKSFVDSFEIRVSAIGAQSVTRINGGNVAVGSVFVSPAGYSVSFQGQQGDWYMFQYDEPSFGLKMKRSAGSVCLATMEDKKPLADGLPSDAGIPSTKSSSNQAPPPATFPKQEATSPIKNDIARAMVGKWRIRFGNGGVYDKEFLPDGRVIQDGRTTDQKWCIYNDRVTIYIPSDDRSNPTHGEHYFFPIRPTGVIVKNHGDSNDPRWNATAVKIQ